eukprot:TRINITY_DN33584_c0_g1_i5.p3 TRINITY_DN33584_c0_g1~~TRINITY_DN33584_c0_g1_i5.p3  ORF type:complete len:158 (+),score=34.91 TRINITY_DN33584_c0_g1_i5:266-739(+)
MKVGTTLQEDQIVREEINGGQFLYRQKMTQVTPEKNNPQKAENTFRQQPQTVLMLKITGIKTEFFFGFLGNLTFAGPVEWKGPKLEFNVDRVQVKIGPFSFGFDQNVEEEKKKQKVQPFFVYTYVDEDILVARGATGGTALWGRTTAEWEIENGIAD